VAIDNGFNNGYYFTFLVDQLRKKKQEAYLGFLSMHIIDPPEGAVWGIFNNRVVDHPWIKSMSETFVNNLDCCTDSHSMDAALDPAWLVDPTTVLSTVEGLKVEEVPVMTFTPEAKLHLKKNKCLWMLGGNHRRLALIKYIEKLQAEAAQTKVGIEKVIGGKSDVDISNMDPDQISMIRDAQRTVKRLEEKIATTGLWPIKVYDRGACSDAPYGDRIADPTSI